MLLLLLPLLHKYWVTIHGFVVDFVRREDEDGFSTKIRRRRKRRRIALMIGEMRP